MWRLAAYSRKIFAAWTRSAAVLARRNSIGGAELPLRMEKWPRSVAAADDGSDADRACRRDRQRDRTRAGGVDGGRDVGGEQLVAVQHRGDEVLPALAPVEGDRADVQHDEHDDDSLAEMLVPVCRDAARRRAHVLEERPGGRDLVVGDEAGRDLDREHAEQGEHRPGAERVVADVMMLVRQAGAAQVAQARRWCVEESRKARPAPAGEAPDDAKGEQGED